MAVLRIGRAVKAVAGSEALERAEVIRVGVPRDRFLEDSEKLLLSAHARRRRTELAAEKDQCEHIVREETARVRELTRNLNLCEWVRYAGADVAAMETEFEELAKGKARLESKRSELRNAERLVPFWRAGAAESAKADCLERGLPTLKERLAKAENDLENAQLESEGVRPDLESARALLETSEGMSWVARRWRGLPEPSHQRMVVSNLEKRVTEMRGREDACQEDVRSTKEQVGRVTKILDSLRAKYGGTPAEVSERAAEHTRSLDDLRRAADSLARYLGDREKGFRSILGRRISVVRAMGLLDRMAPKLEDQIRDLHAAHACARELTRAMDPGALEEERQSAGERVRRTRSRIAEIETLLQRVEQDLIEKAMVVATTLTSAFLRDALHERRFDTVILDEASMAPIPALWIAASLADRSAVVVGDFRQLPPIAVSEEAMALKWLKRHVFEVSSSNSVDPPPWRKDLYVQHRMHPQICSIPNERFYDGKLVWAAP